MKLISGVEAGGEQFRAVAPTKEYLEAAKEAGYDTVGIKGKGFLIMQTSYNIAAKLGLNILYELDVPVTFKGYKGYLTLVARNSEGKRNIDYLRREKMVDIEAALERMKGIAVTTSNVEESLLHSILFSNVENEARLKELKRIQDSLDSDGYKKYLSPNDEEYLDLCLSIEEDENLISENENEIESLKAEKVALKEKVKLSKEEKSSEIARINEATAECKANIKDLKAELTDLLKMKKERDVRIKGYEDIQSQINSLVFHSEEEMEADAKELLSLLGEYCGPENIYVDIQYHGNPEEEKYAAKISKLEANFLASNLCLMPKKSEHYINQRNGAKFLENSVINNPKWEEEYYIKTSEELKEWLLKVYSSDIVENAFNNLEKLATSCTYRPEKQNHAPKAKGVEDDKKALRDEIEKGIKKKYLDRNIPFTQEMRDRIEYEYDVITRMGYASYFLIVQDFLEYAAEAGKIPFEHLDEAPLTMEGIKAFNKLHGYNIGVGKGFGRGSGAGSLVCYVTDITDIDPLIYELKFERFLNPERVSMPDIDSDIATFVREKTIEYVVNKYGVDAVCGIVTMNCEAAKGAIRDAARYYGASTKYNPKEFLQLSDAIRKNVPKGASNFGKPISDEDNTSLYDYLINMYNSNKDAINIINLARDYEGMFTAPGQHAAGVVIYDGDNLNDYIPTRPSTDEENPILSRLTEMDMIDVEAQGLLKMDFLGLVSLNIISDTMRMIYEKTGEIVDFDNIPLSGEKADFVYNKVFAAGNTSNVFQFESPGMKKYLKQLLSGKKATIEDLIAMNALYRPGPMESIPDFIKNSRE